MNVGGESPDQVRSTLTDLRIEATSKGGLGLVADADMKVASIGSAYRRCRDIPSVDVRAMLQFLVLQ